MAARLRPRAAVVILLLLAGGIVAFRIPIVEAGGDLMFGGPRARHVWWLRAAGRLGSRAAEAWASAGQRALQTPRTGTLPASVTLERAEAALAFAIDLPRGQRIDVTVRGPSSGGRVFVEVFETLDGAPERWPAASTGTLAALAYEVTRTGQHFVRVQGEPGLGQPLEVAIAAGPSLAFPVANAGAPAIRSPFGVEREGGRRRHEGVDIFAPRGTSVLSATDGLVTSVGENRLGGLVVWVWNPARGLMLYYAHLDSQTARLGQRVEPGDLLGTVGTTGNARTTPPHLHFGIYSGTEGAIDPEPFIREVQRRSSSFVPRPSFVPLSFVLRPSSLEPWAWHPPLWPLPRSCISISCAGTPRSSTPRSASRGPASASAWTPSSASCPDSGIWRRRSSPPRCS